MNKETIIAILKSNLRPCRDTRMELLEQIADEILDAMPEESECKHLSRTVGDDGWYCNDCGYLENDLDNLSEVANKYTENAIKSERIHIGSDFNEFYIEALEATILDLSGKRPEDKQKIETQIAKRKIEEYIETMPTTEEDRGLLRFVIAWLNREEE